ncbi:MAG: DUF177 domain-containing protein [Proteobacteria bacterium]|nr:DUF177 domain-containing protein [Pseudomonadota bacterium]
MDAWKLARERGSIEGNIDAHRLARIADLLAPGPADIAWRVAGAADAEGRAALAVELAGEVMLTCQRCLGGFAWPIRQEGSVLLAASEGELEALDARTDAEVVLAAGPVDPLDLVEDELLLALPFAPRHPADACTLPAGTMTTHRRT